MSYYLYLIISDILYLILITRGSAMAMVLGQEWDSQALLCLLGTDGTVDDFGSVPDFQLWSRKLKNTTH